MRGGFDPVAVPGQIVLNHDVRPSILIGDIAEIPICIVGLLAFTVLDKLSLLPIYLIVTVPALIASFIGPHITMKIGQKLCRESNRCDNTHFGLYYPIEDHFWLIFCKRIYPKRYIS